MKKFLTAMILAIFLTQPAAFAVDYADLNSPKPPAFRVGLTDTPEKIYVEAVQDTQKVQKTHVEKEKIDEQNIESYNIEDVTYADLSIKKMSKEISTELELLQNDMMEDLTLLWQGAASKSDVINFALYKLANPDENKPNEKSVKKVLTTIAGMSTLVGAGMGNPLLASGALIGGNMLGIMTQDTKALNYKYTRVTDADMIILVRKIEDLQQKTVNLYYDYMTSREKLEMLTKMTEQRKKNYELSQDMPREVILVTDAYYRTALDNQKKANADFYSKRAALEQFVGNDVFKQFETNLKEREKQN